MKADIKGRERGARGEFFWGHARAANFCLGATSVYVAHQHRCIFAAKNQVAMNPINTVFDAKWLIGRRFLDALVQRNIKL
ncbi:unnamed protein product [Urochloa humidicola]